MTEAIQHRLSPAALIPIRQAHDRRQLETLLGVDRAYAAYALSHLESGPFEQSEFWVAESPAGTGVVLTSDAIGSTLITSGDPTAVGAILSLHPGPRLAYLSTASPEHMAAIRRWHHVDDPLTMRRMSVRLEGFTAIAEESPDVSIRRLSDLDLHAVNALYAVDERSGQYTGPQINNAVYFGAFVGGELASIAGTHVVSPMMSIGVVGNVLTHPAFRGRGLATYVTSRVTSTLFDLGCELVVLTADPQNTPAVHAYRRLGYELGAPIVEARLRRRDPVGLGAWWRRMKAEHIQGFEAVRVASAPAGDLDGAPAHGKGQSQ
ncbi:MAG: GNAT family N-acetyltransferase [Dehalococcoidia bacterium]|nr:GNAT family N-acetyltransferase [Dehalococcoidia bacterium]